MSPTDILGKPTIHPVLFVISKLAVLLSWLLVAAKLTGLWSPSTLFPALPFLAGPMFALGLAVIVLAIPMLGPSVRVGLPREETRLRTGGLYRVSRNPMYVGVFLLCIAAILYVPHWTVIACCAAGSILHHRIVLAEETFLDARFGDAWRGYRAKVRRYL
ncbi:MAG: isoprenylcysteine carboxylmethyltransferase family protein [bacterium]